MLAYYIQWHMKKSLQEILNKQGKGKNRELTFINIIENLKQITKNKVTIAGAEIFKISIPTSDQQKILSVLKVAI